MTNTNQWHEMAVAKGFHDNDELDANGSPTARQRLAWVALILTELAEWFAEEKPWYLEGEKPCGGISEIVDVWIRCADTLGACGEPLEGEAITAPGAENEAFITLGVAAECCRTGDHAGYAAALRQVMARAKYVANNGSASPISFTDALAAKTAYNATRSHRHGGKLA